MIVDQNRKGRALLQHDCPSIESLRGVNGRCTCKRVGDCSGDETSQRGYIVKVPDHFITEPES